MLTHIKSSISYYTSSIQNTNTEEKKQPTAAPVVDPKDTEIYKTLKESWDPFENHYNIPVKDFLAKEFHEAFDKQTLVGKELESLKNRVCNLIKVSKRSLELISHIKSLREQGDLPFISENDFSEMEKSFDFSDHKPYTQGEGVKEYIEGVMNRANSQRFSNYSLVESFLRKKGFETVWFSALCPNDVPLNKQEHWDLIKAELLSESHELAYLQRIAKDKGDSPGFKLIDLNDYLSSKELLLKGLKKTHIPKDLYSIGLNPDFFTQLESKELNFHDFKKKFGKELERLKQNVTHIVEAAEDFRAFRFANSVPLRPVHVMKDSTYVPPSGYVFKDQRALNVELFKSFLLASGYSRFEGLSKKLIGSSITFYPLDNSKLSGETFELSHLARPQLDTLQAHLDYYYLLSIILLKVLGEYDADLNLSIIPLPPAPELPPEGFPGKTWRSSADIINPIATETNKGLNPTPKLTDASRVHKISYASLDTKQLGEIRSKLKPAEDRALKPKPEEPKTQMQQTVDELAKAMDDRRNRLERKDQDLGESLTMSDDEDENKVDSFPS